MAVGREAAHVDADLGDDDHLALRSLSRGCVVRSSTAVRKGSTLASTS